MRSRFLPEGRLLHTPENEAACASRDGLRRAMEEETVLEGVAQLCDGAHNLLVSVGPFTGFLPREEAALGIAEGTTREIAILSRVGKPVCFQITALEESEGVLRPRLSRRRAQQAALDAMLAGLHPGCILPAVVTHLESFGAFVDIGCGVPSLIGIENISVSRIPHPDQRFRVGQAIFAVVQELDPKLGRVYLTHRELLGTLSEEDILPGVPETLQALRARGLALAIGSSSKNAVAILERLGLSGWFDAVADGTQIKRSKPDPEVFLLAAEKLGLPAADCLVVEDAQAGIQAAQAGGMDAASVGPAAKQAVGTYQLETIYDLLALFK